MNHPMFVATERYSVPKSLNSLNDERRLPNEQNYIHSSSIVARHNH